MSALPVTAAATVATALVGSAGTKPDDPRYRRLAKPDWQPPPVAFPLVWTPLYVLIALATARLVDAEKDPDERRRLAALIGLDLTANAGWCWAFFAARSPAAGLGVIAVLDVLNLALLREAWRRDRAAALMLAPYVVWTLFATALNLDIWRRNR